MLWVYVVVLLLGVIIGVWLTLAYQSWKQSHVALLKRKAKRENRHLRRK